VRASETAGISVAAGKRREERENARGDKEETREISDRCERERK